MSIPIVYFLFLRSFVELFGIIRLRREILPCAIIVCLDKNVLLEFGWFIGVS